MTLRYRATDHGPFTCNRCGQEKLGDEFYWSRGRRNYWCRACYRDWYRARTSPAGDDNERACRRCGRVYRPAARLRSWFCSIACKDRARKDAAIATRLDDKRALPPRTCLWCGRGMQLLRIDARYCSETCSSRAHSRTRNYHRRVGIRTRPRHVRLVSLIDIAWRSRWRCGICGGRVRPSLAHPDPQAPSLDHILPLAVGGSTEPDNLQLAHLICNLRKRQVT